MPSLGGEGGGMTLRTRTLDKSKAQLPRQHSLAFPAYRSCTVFIACRWRDDHRRLPPPGRMLLGAVRHAKTSWWMAVAVASCSVMERERELCVHRFWHLGKGRLEGSDRVPADTCLLWVVVFDSLCSG